MTKRIIAYMLLFFVSAICTANNKADFSVFETISFRTYYKDRSGTATTKPKTPAKAPTIYLCGHVLLFESDMTGYSTELLSAEDEETVIYEDFITADCHAYELPESLSGEYIIRLTYGNICFVGSIEL